jgi:hypothetical protein
MQNVLGHISRKMSLHLLSQHHSSGVTRTGFELSQRGVCDRGMPRSRPVYICLFQDLVRAKYCKDRKERLLHVGAEMQWIDTKEKALLKGTGSQRLRGQASEVLEHSALDT